MNRLASSLRSVTTRFTLKLFSYRAPPRCKQSSVQWCCSCSMLTYSNVLLLYRLQSHFLYLTLGFPQVLAGFTAGGVRLVALYQAVKERAVTFTALQTYKKYYIYISICGYSC